MTDAIAKQVPLIEQLEAVPETARLVIDDDDGNGTRYMPVGRMCKEAAELLRKIAHQAPKCWGLPMADGDICDCITPEEHSREPGKYTVPLYINQHLGEK